MNITCISYPVLRSAQDDLCVTSHSSRPVHLKTSASLGIIQPLLRTHEKYSYTNIHLSQVNFQLEQHAVNDELAKNL